MSKGWEEGEEGEESGESLSEEKEGSDEARKVVVS